MSPVILRSLKKNRYKLPAGPNILLIVADDLGYSDISPFGGNINTPQISNLSQEGICFSNFHVQPTCSPTRSSLLTGNDNHVAGMGIMSEMDYPELHSPESAGLFGQSQQAGCDNT